MFGHGHSYAVRRLVQQLRERGHEVFVVLQQGCGEDRLEANERLANEYLDVEDLKQLSLVIARRFALVGQSAGAMRAVRFAAQSDRVEKLLLLWCPFDPLQPVLFSHDKQLEMGEPIQQWSLRWKDNLIRNGLTLQQYDNLVEKTTMMKWDQIQADRMQLGIEEYYREININDLI